MTLFDDMNNPWGQCESAVANANNAQVNMAIYVCVCACVCGVLCAEI